MSPEKIPIHIAQFDRISPIVLESPRESLDDFTVYFVRKSILNIEEHATPLRFQTMQNS